MTYLKATIAGIVGAILLATAWTWAALSLPMWWDQWQARSQGGGSVGASSVGSDSILLAAAIGFAIGFFWTVRRTAKRRRSPTAPSADANA